MIRSGRLDRVLLLLFVVGPAGAQPIEALSNGEIFVVAEDVDGFELPRLRVTAVIDAPPGKVYELVANCDRFADRLPRIREARTLSRAETGATCEATVRMPVPLANLTAVTVDTRQQGPDEWFRKWTLADDAESDYEHLVGSFILTRFDNNDGRTLLRHELHAVPKTRVPGFIVNMAMKRSMPQLIRRVRKEVARL